MKANIIAGVALSIFCSTIATAAPRTLAKCDNIEVMRPQKLAENGNAQDENMLPLPASNPAKCDRGVRLDVGTAVVWRCRVNVPETAEYDENQWEHAIIIEAPQPQALTYRSELMAGAYDRFMVTKADLDGDGNRENILATWDSQGNGMGVHTWTIRVFSANWRPISEAFEAKDWGPSAIVKSPNGARCEIAITSWVEDNSRPVTGGALQANFINMIDGTMRPSNDMPILRRRFTFNFQKQRIATFDNPIGNYEGDPIKWLSQTSYVHAGH